MEDVMKFCVTQDASTREAIARIDAHRRGIVLVVDADRRLVGTITDGDIRRAILANVNLQEPVTSLLARKAGSHFATPLTAQAGADRSDYLHLLRRHSVKHLPLLDAEGRVADLVMLDEFVVEQPPKLQAVVMAGGQGVRLTPLTDETPKPMLPIGDRPLMEILIEQLRQAGIRQVKVTTHHKSEKITEHFGDGSNFGVELSYVPEERPLGTAGGLGLFAVPDETTLVINGDILTQVDIRAMLAYHREHRADLTIAVRQYDVTVPYGVVECDGAVVRRISEKPALGFFVNAGIYLLEPLVYRFLSNGERCDMTDLIQRVLDDGRTVVSFPIREYWLDIGQHQDYERAQQFAKGLETA
ncbi:MAG: nucleotidyltransferase family protein [Candidatus Omnitrophota bacterium]|nr:nucleotidyltransferase family protein [Candidatus Omnitrophota bacterium]